MRIRWTIGPAAVLALAVWAVAAPAPPRLEIHQFKYQPASVTVEQGTTVSWVNHDDETHTVTSSTGLFASPALETDQTFAHTFAKPGTYTYFCALHPHMKAVVVVKGD